MFLPPEKEDKAEPLTVDHFVFALGLYVIGIGVSCLLYIMESLGWVARRYEKNDEETQQTLFYKRKMQASSQVSVS